MSNAHSFMRLTDMRAILKGQHEVKPLWGVSEVEQIGDAHDVVAVLFLNRESLAFLCDELPQWDGFTKELQEALARVDRNLEHDRLYREADRLRAEARQMDIVRSAL